MRGLWESGAVWIALVALFLLSWLVQPRSVSALSLGVMLPFAAILAIAAVGQTLVIQQRGIDLSVGGTVTIAAVVVSKADLPLPVAIGIVLVISAVIGLLLGVVVNILRVTSLITTLAAGTILGGVALAYTKASPSSAPPALVDFVGGTWLGASRVVWLAVVVVVVAWVLMNRTVVGRRFVAVGANTAAARGAAVKPLVYGIAAYTLAALCYGIAGIVLAGYVQSPGVKVGDDYMMSSIAAVVVGGTSLGGGRGRLIGSAVGALLLGQLTQLVLSLGAPTSTQMIVQAAVIAVAAAIQPESRRTVVEMLRKARAWRPRKVPEPAR